jgi:hypothetical protein
VKSSECDSVAKIIIKKVEDPQTGTLSEKSNITITSRSNKDQRSGLTAALAETFGQGFENIKVNIQFFLFHSMQFVILYYIQLSDIYKSAVFTFTPFISEL